MTIKTNFSEFTNLYELSKTLRFELKPVGETQKHLNENKVFEDDKLKDENYHKIKLYLDELHRIFTKESLEKLDLDFEEIEKVFLENSKKSKKELTKKDLSLFDKSKEKLRKELVKNFNETGKKWKEKLEQKVIINQKGKEQNLKIKGDGLKILLGESILEILKDRFPESEYGEKVLIENTRGEKINLFDSFKGFTTYFSNFHQSRDNFYKSDGTASAIATRVIDENLIFFLKNKQVFENYQKNGNIDFSEVENNFNCTLEEVFTLENYNNLILQDGINELNKIIGGISLEDGSRKRGLNELINEAKQKSKEKLKLSYFKLLYKQILGEVKKEEQFLKDENLVENLKNYVIEFDNQINTCFSSDSGKKGIFEFFEEFLANNEAFSVENIYFRDIFIEEYGRKFLKDYYGFEQLDEKVGGLPKIKNEDKFKLKEYLNFYDLKKSFDFFENENGDGEFVEIESFFKEKYFENNLVDKNLSYYENFLQLLFFEFKKIFEGQNIDDVTLTEKEHKLDKNKQDKIKEEKRFKGIIKSKENLENLLEGKDILEKTEQEKKIIKEYFDSIKSLDKFFNTYFLIRKKDRVGTLDSYFYNNVENNFIESLTINYAYNKVRNFLTKKPFSEDKIKLNFENGTLLDGWDKNKEPDNYGVVLRKNGKYFLALMKKGNNHIFNEKKKIDFKENESEFYEKMEYKFLPDPKKMLPKVCFAKSNFDLFKPIEEILKIKENETFKTGEKFNENDFYKIVDFYKDCLKKYPDWQVFTFDFSDTKTYKNLSDFYKEVEKGSYNIKFNKIGSSYIYEKVELGQLYLFEIYNKDFSENKTGKENLHTKYFKGLFEEKNLKNPVLKLNGQAEIFFRKASLEKKIDKDRKSNNEIVENKRYTKDKILFHCPIKLNFANHNERVNLKINEYLAKNKEVNIIGIDRGEKHLAYFSIIKQNGEIIKQGSFNEVNSQNYYKKLDERERERQEARGSWKTIGNIKNLKEGYISQIVHKLAELVIKHNAIIVFEDLNMGFKKGRQKIEKQIYQKLEKALIDKFNYLVFKDKDFGENGHYSKAYQLTAPFETFQKMGKQTGIIFYTDASYTSTTCPECGWRKNIYIKYKNEKGAKEEFEKFERIYFEEGKNRFVFEYKPEKFGKSKIKEINKVFSDLKRLKWNKNLNLNKGGIEEFFITEKLQELFKEFNLDLLKDLKEQIIFKNTKKLYESTIYFLNLILQIRNSKTGDNSDDGDFISCPRCYFDSRKENKVGIRNGDDNGAYNIARKGMIILNKINEFKKEKGNLEKLKWGDLYVSNNNWDEFAFKKGL